MSAPFIHPHALCESPAVGAGTRIWAFAHVLPGARIGTDCNICDGVFIENDVIVGNRVTLKCGIQLWDGLRIEDDVFIGPNATFTNDEFPRSRRRPSQFLQTWVRRGASVGANATILPGIELGSGAMIGAGAVVTRSVPPNAIVVGNPARIVGYTHLGPEIDLNTGDEKTFPLAEQRHVLGVGGAELVRIRRVGDLRGELTVAEFDANWPFVPKRFFTVFNVPTRETRGEHAHRNCHQLLICAVGSCVVLLDDTKQRQELRLDRPEIAIYMPPMIWSTQYQYSSDCILLVFASEHYDSHDYIRTYDAFLTEIREIHSV